MTSDESDPGGPVTILRINGGELAFQAFGPADAPPVVLVAGAGSQNPPPPVWDRSAAEVLRHAADSA